MDKTEHTFSYVSIWTFNFDAVFGQRLRFAKNATAFFGIIDQMNPDTLQGALAIVEPGRVRYRKINR